MPGINTVAPGKKRLLLWGLGLTLGALALALTAPDVLAQAKNPFGVGISEGGSAPPQGGLTGWIFDQQKAFERMLSGAVRAIKADTAALWTLLGISFAYGVFHAAGPGHGKAVVASYMIANERALRRGIVISFLAAILQGLVAIAIVGVLAYLLNATSQRMKSVANLVEVASFAGIALLGLWLTWTKGRALLAALRGGGHGHDDGHDHAHAHEHVHAEHARHGHDHHGHDHHGHDHHGHDHHGHDSHSHHGHVHAQGDVALTERKPAHGEAGHVHDEHCGHFHAPDPRTLGENFSWGTALATVVTAGARPCSGAILVLVFAAAQGIFWAGIAAAFAMALGTAITTGALAAVAVLAKDIAIRFTGEGGARGVLFVRALECAAAVGVLLLGAFLFAGSLLA